MTERLFGLSGIPQGEEFQLAGLLDVFSIGRNDANSLTLNDWAVSRQHCVIRREGNDFWIEDLNSHNRTFVNDSPVVRHRLAAGDRIRIGGSEFVFITETDVPLRDLGIEYDDGAIITKSDLRLRLDALDATSSAEARFLGELGRLLASNQSHAEIQQQLLSMIMNLVPAERGAIVFGASGTGEPDSVCTRHRSASEPKPMIISRTVSRQVLQGEIAILSNELSAISSESLAFARVSALLCVPLPVAGTDAFIYLDSQDPATRFTEEHLAQVTALASVIAAALTTKQRIERLARRNEQLQSESLLETNLIGESPQMREVLHLISRVARSDANVLLSAESGTGKELVARAIHRNSARRDGPFVAINCAVLSEQLLESTLFGHEKGSFTGAIGQKKGKFEAADGGTIFLDEIGELAPELQAKLLRVVQEREFERIGGNRPLKVDVRLLAATNRALKQAVKSGLFREDLYFRLNVVEIRLPPLRERTADIARLAEHFIRKYAERCHRGELRISPEALAALENYDWPGNVRELENAVERAVVFVNSEMIEVEDLPEPIIDAWTKEEVAPVRYFQRLHAAKREIVRNALIQAKGSYPMAAQALGIHPNNLHRMSRTLGLKAEADGSGENAAPH